MSEKPTLNKCPKCKKNIQKAVKTCPECGLNIKRRAIINIAVIIAGIAILVGMFIKGSVESRAKKLAECKESAQCTGNNNQHHFYNYCGYAIEKSAKFASRWTNGKEEPQFDKFIWLDQPTKKITGFGGKIQFQTKSGTWQGMSYECDLDLLNKKVINIRLK
jgi:hypothetical protein